MTYAEEVGIKIETALAGGKTAQRIGLAAANAITLFGAFLAPAAGTALVLGLWRLAADLGWASQFFIERGILSHWIVWIALAALLRFLPEFAKPQRNPEAEAAPHS